MLKVAKRKRYFYQQGCLASITLRKQALDLQPASNFGAIPNELKDQLSIFDEPNAINRQDALILDPGYSFQAGHHENSNLAVFEILQSSQHSRVTLICSLNARVSTEVNSLMNVSKTLWTNPYAHNGKQWSARDIEGLNEAFYQDLKQNLGCHPVDHLYPL